MQQQKVNSDLPATKFSTREDEGNSISPRAASPLRVLVVGPSLDILGGQAVQAARLLARLRDEPSLEVSFLPVNPRLPGIARRLQAIKYVRTVVTSLAYIASLLRRVRRYDVIHIYSASYLSFVLAPTPAMLVAKLYGKQIILNYHSGKAEDHLTRWRRTAIPTMRLADKIIVQSDYLVDVFARFDLRASAIFNNIETDSFRYRERNALRPIFLSNRNLESLYNVQMVLRAFAIIQRRYPEARLVVAGEGSERVALESLARELELRDTEFVGSINPERMPELYDAADIYLNGSDIDNMPLSILESFAVGVPVVTTDAGGIPYIVTDKETGLLVPRGDYEAMAARAINLLEDKELATKLARAAHKECRKYSWAKVRDEWLKLYSRLGAVTGKVEPLEQQALTNEARVRPR